MQITTSQIGCISPRRQARGRRTLQISKFTNQTFQDDFTTTFQNKGSLWKTMVSKFEQLVQPICEFAHLPLEGTNAKMASHIGCISPRRQARRRRTLQIPKFTNRTFQDDCTTFHLFCHEKANILCPPFRIVFVPPVWRSVREGSLEPLGRDPRTLSTS